MNFLKGLFNKAASPFGDARIPDGQRIYAVGDIHGRADLLGEMRELIAADLRDAPVVAASTVLLGDYIDRGPDSKGVLQQLGSETFPTPLIPLYGNHEAMLIGFLVNPAAGANWCPNGGLETLRSFGVDARRVRGGQGYEEASEELRKRLSPEQFGFLKSCRFSYAVGDYFFCHAGVRPGVPLDRQQESDLLWVREPFLSFTGDFGATVVHGHTPVLEPEVRPNRINIDTGAYVTGRLSCLVLEQDTRRFLSTGSSAALRAGVADAAQP